MNRVVDKMDRTFHLYSKLAE